MLHSDYSEEFMFSQAYQTVKSFSAVTSPQVPQLTSQFTLTNSPMSEVPGQGRILRLCQNAGAAISLTLLILFLRSRFTNIVFLHSHICENIYDYIDKYLSAETAFALCSGLPREASP